MAKENWLQAQCGCDDEHALNRLYNLATVFEMDMQIATKEAAVWSVRILMKVENPLPRARRSDIALVSLRVVRRHSEIAEDLVRN